MTEVNRMQNKKETQQDGACWAHVCWVLQRDIKLDNLFIISIMSRSPYKSYSGMHSIIYLFYVKGFRKTTLH